MSKVHYKWGDEKNTFCDRCLTLKHTKEIKEITCFECLKKLGHYDRYWELKRELAI